MAHVAIALLDRALADRQRDERDRGVSEEGNRLALYDEAERWELVRQARAQLAAAEPVLRWFASCDRAP